MLFPLYRACTRESVWVCKYLVCVNMCACVDVCTYVLFNDHRNAALTYTIMYVLKNVPSVYCDTGDCISYWVLGHVSSRTRGETVSPHEVAWPVQDREMRAHTCLTIYHTSFLIYCQYTDRPYGFLPSRTLHTVITTMTTTTTTTINQHLLRRYCVRILFAQYCVRIVFAQYCDLSGNVQKYIHGRHITKISDGNVTENVTNIRFYTPPSLYLSKFYLYIRLIIVM